jgi:hypothetical protein
VPIASNIAVGASARRSFLDLIRNTQRSFSGTGDDVLLVPTYWDYQLKLDWDTAPGHELVVFAFGSGDREEYVADGAGAIDQYLRTNDSDFHRVSLRYSHNIGNGFTHVFTPVVGYARTTLNEQGGLRFKNTETFDGQLRDELTWRSGTSKVLIGLDATARNDGITWGGLLARNDVPDLPPVDLSVVSTDDRVRLDTWRVTAALYTEGTLEPLDGVFLTPGLRVETYMLDEEPSFSLEPRFAGSWQIIPGEWGTLVRVAAGQVSRPPDPDELAVARDEGFDLPPQKALHIQGGVEQSLGDRLTMSATIFEMWRGQLTTKSPTFPVPERFGERAIYGGGSGHSTGFEALLRVGVPKRYFAWLTYSLTRNERTDAPGPYAQPSTYLSPSDTTHLLGVVGQTYLPWGFRFGARYRIASGMPEDVALPGGLFDSDTGRFTPVLAPKGSAHFPLFQALDVRVDWSTVLDWFELDLYADLVNFNTIFGRPTEGRLYNYDFSETQPRLGLPLIPAIGAKATF